MPLNAFVLVAGWYLQLAGASRMNLHQVRSQINTAKAADLAERLAGERALVCTEKFEQATGTFTSEYCLAPVQGVLGLTNMDAGKSWAARIHALGPCESKKHKHLMKVCGIKGEIGRQRISYAARVWAPKICFRHATRPMLLESETQMQGGHVGGASRYPARLLADGTDMDEDATFPVPILEMAMTAESCEEAAARPEFEQKVFSDPAAEPKVAE